MHAGETFISLSLLASSVKKHIFLNIHINQLLKYWPGLILRMPKGLSNKMPENCTRILLICACYKKTSTDCSASTLQTTKGTAFWWVSFPALRSYLLPSNQNECIQGQKATLS